MKRASGGGPGLVAVRSVALGAVVLGAGLRLAGLGEPSLRSDEIFVVSRAAGPVGEVLGRISQAVMAAPLEFLLRNGVLRFSESELWLRFPDAVFGAVTVYLTYALASRLFTPGTGALASLLLAVSSLHVFHSQDARYYALFAMLSTAGTLALEVALERDRRRDWALYAALMTLGFYAAYFTAFVALVHGLYVLGVAWLERRRLPRGFVAAGGVVAAAVAPWALRLAASDASAPVDYAGPGAGRALANFASDFSNGPGVAAVLGWLLCACGLAFAWRERRAAASLCAAFLLVPFPLIGLADAWAGYFFVPRQMIFALPFFLALLAYGLVRGARAAVRRLPRLSGARLDWIAVGFAAAVWIALALPAIGGYHGYQQGDWRGAARYLAERIRPGDVLAATRHPFGPPDGDNVGFYLDRLGVSRGDYQGFDPTRRPPPKLETYAARRRVWFVTAHPRFYRKRRPGLLARVERDFDRVAEFRGEWTQEVPLAVYRSRSPLAFLADAGLGSRRRTVMMGDYQEGESLDAVEAGPPERFAFQLPPEVGPRVLEFAVGVQAPRPGPPSSVRFRVRQEGGAEPLFEREVELARDRTDSGWRHHRVRLEGGSEPGVFTLETDWGDASAPRDGVAAWWGDPSVRPILSEAITPVVMIAIDTLRADHVSAYGYPRPTTPSVDAFAEDAIRFETAIVQAPWTLPSFASLLSSSYAARHGAGRRDLLRAHAPGMDLAYFDGLAPGVPTLPEALREHGYRSLLLSNNVFLSSMLGFDRAFGRSLWKVYPDWRGEDLARAARGWLRRYARAPFFLLLDFMDPHTPYQAPDRFATAFRRPPGAKLGSRDADAYDAEVAYADQQVGAVLAELRRLDLYDRALVVVLSDHGEELRERGGVGHGHSRYEEMIRTPLLIKLPQQRQAGRVVASLVRNLDLAPTILDYLSLPFPEGFRGESVLPLLGDGEPPARVAFTESEGTFSEQEKVSVRTQRYKLVYNVQSGGEELFDLARDPRESRDLSGSDPPVAAGLRELAYGFLLEKFAGLHLACASGSPAVVSGTIGFAEPVVTRVHPFFLESGDSVRRVDAREVRFSLRLEGGFDALLVQGPGPADSARFELAQDGAPMSVGRLGLGFPPGHPASNPWSSDGLGDYALGDFEAAARTLSEDGRDAPRCFAWAVRLGEPQEERAAPPGPMDPELRERLRALGYAE